MATFPHDPAAFTQGLLFHDGVLYEGTGLYGESALRRVDLSTGKVLRETRLPKAYFGEGITLFEDRLIQLTWQERTGFVYDRKTLQKTGEFRYQTQGWGLTHDGQRLIMSDGTSALHFLDPGSFEVSGHLDVTDRGAPVTRLNELEFVNGRIFANVWKTDRLAIIDPGTGTVTGWADLSGLLGSRQVSSPEDVLNGIAHDPAIDRLFVTGKRWPWIFEIKLVSE